MLTLRGLELAIRACLEYGGELPAFILLENVPRIKTRGKSILERMVNILKKYGFVVDTTDHNLGEIGGLGQNRSRFLLIARNEARVPNFCYKPAKKGLRPVGHVIEALPLPGDIAAGGPMHRLPNLEWKTWVRLALIPAGGDWRDLNNIEWEKYHVEHLPRGGAFAVERWEEPSRTVTGTAGPGRSNGAAAISDPRTNFGYATHTAIYRVSRWDEAGPTVTGAHRPNNGAITISDPRLKERDGRHPGVYHIVRADEPAPCVTGTRFGSGAIAISDPRCKTELHPDCYGVLEWSEPSKTVRSASRIMQSAASISDPRISDRPGRYTDKFRMQEWVQPAATVTGTTDVQSGAQLLADPRFGTEQSKFNHTYRVTDWSEVGGTVISGGHPSNGGQTVADPRIKPSIADGLHEYAMYGLKFAQEEEALRIPADDERGAWVIIAEDGTWHRPLTTFELAMLQSFPRYLPDGRPFQLERCSDAKAREYIGNAVPPHAAEGTCNMILLALAEAEAGIMFRLSYDEVWVAPEQRPSLPAIRIH